MSRMQRAGSARGQLIASMLIFGTLGVFVTNLSLSSAAVACYRACLGTGVLGLWFLLGRRRLSRTALRQNLILLLLSGGALGFNWILLFESYRFTTVAVGTLCYYMAPVFVILLSPLLLRERLTRRGLLCAAGAVAGAVLVSGATAGAGGGSLKGIGLGLAAAGLYCSIVLLNRFIRDISAPERTLCQLAVSAMVMLPYVLLTEGAGALALTAQSAPVVLLLGIVHTGIAYLLFFGGVARLPAQSSALLSYIDPATAILLSALVLHQPMNGWQLCGAVLILGSTLLYELPGRRQAA